MTSTNEDLPSPSKAKLSPFDYRNTDLVSRLLAATPPYLYNMPLVPHSFFFSEMLRSLVQAKAENANRNASAVNVQHRRSRKRPWTQSHSEYYHHKEQSKTEKLDMPPPANWMGKSEKCSNNYHCKVPEGPLELTTDKFNLNNNNKINMGDGQQDPRRLSNHHIENNTINTHCIENDKSEIKPSHLQFPFSLTMPQTSTSSELILPPPPPVWYPPLYPTPCGIDPLHFFIDLRVSGHIYDRKNSRGSPNSSQTVTTSPSLNSTQERCSLDISQSMSTLSDPFRQNRHVSAFSVPSSRLTGNIPINLSNYSQTGANGENKIMNSTKSHTGHTKFDVKSMGFERTCNKISSNYIMANIFRIYKELHESSFKKENSEGKEGENTSETVIDTETNETEEIKEKKVRDLRALIGLELVVDYMNQAKPGQPSRTSEESSTDLDSSDSIPVDVVALQEENEEYGI